MNAALNTVVADISTKIREQEDERIAQDKENSDLRVELQVSTPGNWYVYAHMRKPACYRVSYTSGVQRTLVIRCLIQSV